jgi:uncharacterized protein
MNRNLLLLLCSLFCFIAIGKPSDFPPVPNPPKLINDFAGMLSPAEVAELERKVNTFNDSTSIEISVVIITNLGDYDIAEYAFQLGALWGIGKDKKDNGVLLLISKENRKAFIATGYGMEGVLPDARCKRIIQAELIPQFKRSNYFNGINFTIDAIMRYSKNEYTADPVSANANRIKPAYVLLFIIGVIILVSFLNRNNNSGSNRGGNNGGYGSGGGGLLGGLLGGAIGSGYRGRSYGGGFGSGSSGGGFGGFGGGGFGGGGAGGDW